MLQTLDEYDWSNMVAMVVGCGGLIFKTPPNPPAPLQNSCWFNGLETGSVLTILTSRM